MIGWGDGLPRFQAKLAGQLDGPGRLTEASSANGPPRGAALLTIESVSPELTYSVVLITKDRPARAERMLAQISRQTWPPRQMVIVDASNPPLSLSPDGTARARRAGIELVVVRSKPSMPAQRNRGIDLVEAPVALIVDDDVIIPPDYMERLLERWDERG